MHIHWLQHVPFEGLGTIADWAKERGHTLTCTKFWAGESLPDPQKVQMLVVMGGPMDVHDGEAYPWLADEKCFIRAVAEQDGVILGICLGAQLLADVFGADVSSNHTKEIGWYPISRADSIPDHLRSIFPEKLRVFHWHGDTFNIPVGGDLCYSSAACRNQVFALGERILGLQFHLEMTAEGVAALIDNCRDELQPGEWIQTERNMFRFAEEIPIANRVMAGIMSYIELQVKKGK